MNLVEIEEKLGFGLGRNGFEPNFTHFLFLIFVIWFDLILGMKIGEEGLGLGLI